jgi:ribosomal protein S27E
MHRSAFGAVLLVMSQLSQRKLRAAKMKCPYCFSSDIEVDAARGDAICTGCGAVLQVTLGLLIKMIF